MKPPVSGMTKFSLFLITVLLGYGLPAQKLEREHRILENQIPDLAKSYFRENISDAHKVRYYKEVDSFGTRYRIKFKMARLHYALAFDGAGNPIDIEFSITPVDIPDESMGRITAHLNGRFPKFKIRHIGQDYRLDDDSEGTQFRSALQNLILPQLQYIFTIWTKVDGRMATVIQYFDADGRFLRGRVPPPPNHDHTLY